MSFLQLQPSIKQEGTTHIENLPSVKKYICSLCGFKFSEEKLFTNHVKLCNNIENPDDRLGVDPTAIKKEEMDSTDLVYEQVTSELILDIKDEEEMEFTETTVTVYGQSIDALKLETSGEVFPWSKYGNAAAQSTHFKERVKVCKSEKLYKCNERLGEKPYKCTLCDYASAQKATLKRHMGTHTGEKPFLCTLCDYTSARRATLIHHTRTHTGEKPFKCTFCDYSCAQSHQLIRHMRTHSNEKPFKCTICDYAGIISGNLTRHMRKHSGGKQQALSGCD